MSTCGHGRVGSKGNLMEKPKDPGIRTTWTAALAAGRRPRLVAAACALVLAAPLAVVAATGTVAQARPDGGAARAARGVAADGGTGRGAGSVAAEGGGGLAPTVNWAVAGSASATTAESGKPAANAVDGDAGTDWCTSGYTGTLTVDLGQVRSLADLGLTLDAASTSASATIELANTAGAWQRVPALGDIALDPGNPLYFPLPSGSRARYAELTVYSDTGADVCVGEFRAFGPDAAAAGTDFGTDLSFTPQELAAGAAFSYNGKRGTPVTITREAGANYVRTRVWVNPPDGYSDLASDLALARQVDAAGMRIYLDNMYSDFWADPQHQDIPAAWAARTSVSSPPRPCRTPSRSSGRSPSRARRWTSPRSGTRSGTASWPVGEVNCTDCDGWDNLVQLLKAGVAGAEAGN